MATPYQGSASDQVALSRYSDVTNYQIVRVSPFIAEQVESPRVLQKRVALGAGDGKILGSTTGFSWPGQGTYLLRGSQFRMISVSPVTPSRITEYAQEKHRGGKPCV